MGAETKIEWCDHTFNPWIGCTKVSPACDHCYAEALARRYGWAEWGAGKPRVLTSDANWKKPLAWNKAAQRDGVRRRVFCASLADIFDAEVPDAWRGEFFAQLVDKTPQLDWLLLTKRPQVAKKWAEQEPFPPNVWLGTTVEDQTMADLRIPILLSVKAAKRFLSCEPLLGPVDLSTICTGHYFIDALQGIRYHDAPEPGPWEIVDQLDWVIAGGESGHGARPMHPAWARTLRDQCQKTGVPFFFKQWGEWKHGSTLGRHPDRDSCMLIDGRLIQPTRDKALEIDREPGGWSGMRPEMMARVGKAAAGAMLDGREWREFPT